MIRIALRATCILAILLILGFSDALLRQRESYLPLGATASFSMDYKASTLSKAAAVTELGKTADAAGATVWKAVPDRADFLNGKDLYRFGASMSGGEKPIDWYDSSRHGAERSARDLGDASLDGLYTFKGSSEALSAVQEWAQSRGIAMKILPVNDQALTRSTLLSAGFGTTFLFLGMLVVIAALASAVAGAHPRALRVASGQSPASVIAADLTDLIRWTAPAVLGAFGVGILAMGLLRGWGNLGAVLRVSLPCTAIFVLVMLAVFAAVSLIAWPTAGVIARRETGALGYRAVSELVKTAALVLTAASVPLLVIAVQASLGITTEASLWKVMKDDVQLRVMTNTPEEDDALQPLLKEAVVRGERSKGVILNYVVTEGDKPLAVGSYDAVVIVNSAFLDRVSEQGLGSVDKVPVPSASEPGMDSLKSSLDLWCHSSCLGTTVQTYELKEGGQLPGLSALATSPLKAYSHPLILRAENISTTFGTDFLGPLVTSGNILFTSGQLASSLVDQLNLRGSVLSIDRAADVGLQQGQSSHDRALVQMSGILFVLTALVFSTFLAARIYAGSRAIQIFAQRTAGLGWLSILRRRIALEGALALVVCLAAWAYLSSLDAPLPWTVLGVPLVYLLLSLAAHQRAASHLVADVIERRESV